jgi:hypothetical protein
MASAPLRGAVGTLGSARNVLAAAGCLGGIAALLAPAGGSGLPPEEAERFRGGLPRACRSSHTGRFMNPWLTVEGKDPCDKGFPDFLRALRNWQEVPASNLTEDLRRLLAQPRAVDWDAVRVARDDVDGQALATWLVHATVLCACRGRLVLCDPVFSARASPFRFVGPLRFVESPVDLSLICWPEDLAPDAVFISHVHYDHLDEETVLSLHRRFPKAKFVAPMGLGSWFRDRGIP